MRYGAKAEAARLPPDPNLGSVLKNAQPNRFSVAQNPKNQ